MAGQRGGNHHSTPGRRREGTGLAVNSETALNLELVALCMNEFWFTDGSNGWEVVQRNAGIL